MKDTKIELPTIREIVEVSRNKRAKKIKERKRRIASYHRKMEFYIKNLE